MGWTRKFFDQWEWYHKPVSPMEETLLLPEHINQALSLISRRLGVKFPPQEKTWKVIDGYLYFTDKYWKLFLQIGIFLLPFRFFQQLPKAKYDWLNEALPSYQKKIDDLRKINLDNYKGKELIELLKDTVKTEGKLMAESVYTVLYAIFSEISLKIAYWVLIKDKNPLNYHELLIGYPDRGIKSDIRLWEIAQIKNKIEQDKLLHEWLEEYGYRIQDKDISYPTLGENIETVKTLLNIYKDSPNPQERVKISQTRREARERYVKVNLLPFTEFIFTKIKGSAQEYAQIRNSRPYYYQGNQIIRKILLILAGRIPKFNEPKDIFFLYLDELEIALNGGEVKKLKEEIVKRKILYEKRLSEEPQLIKNE